MGYWATLKATYYALQKWSQKNVSPDHGSEGGLSVIYPRVWTFKLDLTTTFVQAIATKMSGKEDSHRQPSFSLVNDDEFLTKLVIDEYLNRIRVHRWLESKSNSSRYDWFDLDKSTGTYWNFGKTEHHKGALLWEYATETMADGDLALSCSWERDEIRKRPYLQLILWLDYWRESNENRFRDIVFKIPLEPGRLCDEKGHLVWVQGHGSQEFKAGDLELFPCDEDEWESDKEKDSNWHWWLRMKTFHTYGGLY
jgi:hypothetical protein